MLDEIRTRFPSIDRLSLFGGSLGIFWPAEGWGYSTSPRHGNGGRLFVNWVEFLASETSDHGHAFGPGRSCYLRRGCGTSGLLYPCPFSQGIRSQQSGQADCRSYRLLFFGVVYIPWLFLFVAKLLYLTPRDAQGCTTGQYLVVFVVAVTKFTDVGAFLCGSLFGKNPFFPNISPQKTWEGIGGALVLAVLTGVGIFRVLGAHLPLFLSG